MTKKLTMFCAILMVVAAPGAVFATDDFFGNAFIVLNLNGGGNTFYDFNPDTQTGNPDFNGTFLGTFNPSLGDSLLITGGEFNTFQDGGDNVNSVNLNYRVYSGSPPGFSSTGIDFVSQSGNNKFWQSTNQNINLLSGLSDGTYSFEIFGSADTTPGPRFYNNGGANYIATFTVVPEPSTLSLLAGPLLLGGWFFLRRRRAS